MQHIKEALTSANLLIHPTPWHLFVIDTDASRNCIGAVLQQSKDALGLTTGRDKKDNKSKRNERFAFKEKDLRPIAFESRRMTQTEQRYSAQECEMLAVVYVLQKWRGYIEGSPILVRTDHESLKHFLTQKHLGRRIARFADDITHFDVEIIYRPGKHQLVADALSCRKGHKDIPETETLKPLFTGTMDQDEEKETENDGGIYKIYEAYKQRLQKGEDPRTIGNSTYLLMGNILYRRIRNQWGAEIDVEVPTSDTEAEEAVRSLHNNLGHLGTPTMVKALQTRFSILYARKLVQEVVRTCNPCQFANCEPAAMQVLHPIARADIADAWAMDFVGPLPKTDNGNQYILTAMDLGSDWTIAQAIPHKSREAVVSLLCYIITTHRKPVTLLTDNREEFTSYLIQNVLRRFGIQHRHTTPYHPQTNRRLEKFNNILVQMLARMSAPQ
jgi:hypothetical protein